jgi:hypothetical protein
VFAVRHLPPAFQFFLPRATPPLILVAACRRTPCVRPANPHSASEYERRTMHTWVRRGLRTALVTGGLLMLGTGIASADENVNPDLPPSPVDAGVSVPVNVGHLPLSPAMHRDMGKAVASKVAATPAPARSVVGRANPLVRQAQPVAQRVATQKTAAQQAVAQQAATKKAGSTLSGTLTAAQMAVPMRTANGAVSSANGAMANQPMAQRLPSVPQNGVLGGVPVVPSIPGVGLFDGPQAQAAPATLGALPSAPSVSSVRNVVSGASSHLPVTYQAAASTSAVPTAQGVPSTQLLDNSPLDSLPGLSSLGGLISGVLPLAQHEVPASAAQSLPTPSADLHTAPKIEPVVRDVDSASSHVQVHPAEAPTSAVRPVQALSSSPLGARPSVPKVPSVPDVTSAPTAQSVVATVPATQAAVLPISAVSTTALPTPIADLVQPFGQSTLGALPGVPSMGDEVGSLFGQLPLAGLTGAPSSVQHRIDGGPLRTAPLAPGRLDHLPDKVMPMAAEVPSSVRGGVGNSPFSALPGASNTLVPSAARTALTVGRSALGSLPGDPGAAVFGAVPQVTGVPSSVRSGVNNSPLGAVPGAPQVPSVPTAGSLADDALDVASSPTHVTRMAEVPASDINTSNLPSAPVGSVSYSPAGRMFGVPTVREAATRSLGAVPVTQMAQVPETISHSVNESPFTSLPGDPRVPSVPSAPDLAVRTASQPPVSYVTGAPSSAAHQTQVFGRPSAALPGVSDTDGVVGVLPVVQDVFPRI